ncbi:MAG: mechanosensitive ion channel family protein [Thermodesulfovibrionales bacterium]|nr:mechanosensitive ion channel family protein [Thermodesulfovibrionales bacterium]
MQPFIFTLTELRGLIGTNFFGSIIPFIISITFIVFLLLLRLLFLKFIKSFCIKRYPKINDVIYKSIKFPSLIWSITFGVYGGIYLWEISAKYLLYLNKLIVLIIILSMTLFIANIVKNGIQFYINRFNLSIPATSLISSILYVIIFITGLLLMLTTIGISITPIITTLGIGGLAIALALKDTLSNIFAGLHILIEKSIRVGDFVRLENGQEGYLEDLTWRTARIRTISNNMIIIPNSRLSQSMVLNYSYPDKRMSIQIPISVDLRSNFELVEDILLDVTNKAAEEIQGLLNTPKPVVRFTPNFSEGSLDFTLICTIEEFKYQNAVQHELRKRILKRLQAEGIEMQTYQKPQPITRREQW